MDKVLKLTALEWKGHNVTWESRGHQGPSFIVTYVAGGCYSTSYNGPLGTSRGLFPTLADAIEAGRQWAGVVLDACP